MIRIIQCAVVAGFVLVGAATLAREWTDASGQYKVEAEFVELSDGVVKLRRPNGTVLGVPLEKLSVADRAAAQSLAAGAQAEPAAARGAAAQPAACKAQLSAHWASGKRIDQQGNELPPDIVVDVRLTGKPAADASAYGFVQVTENKAGGKDLDRIADFFAVPEEEYVPIDREGGFGDQAQHPKGAIEFPLVFTNPGPVKKIDSIKGTLKLRTGGKTTIVQATEVQTKQAIDDPALKQAGIQVKLRTEKDDEFTHLHLAFSGDVDAIHAVAIHTADGKQPENWAGGGESRLKGKLDRSFTFQGALPKGHVLKIILLSGAEELEVPFAGSNLAIGQPRF